MLVLLSRLFCAVPLGVALLVGRVCGLFWYYLFPIRRGVALANVRRVFGDKLTKAEQRRIVRRCFVHFAMYAVEGLRLRTLSPESADALVAVENGHLMQNARARGKGVIGVTAHIGNFDLGICAEAVRGMPLNVIFKDIKWKPAQELWHAIRNRTGLKRIAPRRSKEDIKTALARGDVVGFAIDQHMAPHRAIVCSFFGHLASTTPAPIRFALETGAPVLAVVAFRKPDGRTHVVRYGPEITIETPYDDVQANIRHNTERLNRVVEGFVQEFPEQWLWMHKRWKVHDNPASWEIPKELEHLHARH